jgi:hypothetical protein
MLSVRLATGVLHARRIRLPADRAIRENAGPVRAILVAITPWTVAAVRMKLRISASCDRRHGADRQADDARSKSEKL